ncbi:MAG: hypothetical protein AD742_17640 [Methylibium sp. NZG]|nr:MAG: hypothetical protein AD742_17640 [Methylibium sp. NZG]
MKTLSLLLTLPFMLGLALGMHWFVSRTAKAVAWAAAPLATGEAEAYRYERRTYHTAHAEMLWIIALALCGGLLFWGALHWSHGWLWVAGLLLVAAAVALDLWVWERVSASANFLWAQRGLRGEVKQVAIENIRDLSVEENDTAGGFTFRHGRANRSCRLLVGLADKQQVDLPWTDAHTGLDDVEAMANHLRARQSIRGEGQALKQAQDEAGAAARAAAAQPASRDAEMMRELKRLRKNALAPDVPKAAPRK